MNRYSSFCEDFYINMNLSTEMHLPTNPESIEGVLDQHRLVLELAPYMLSVSPLDCEALDLLFGFDFTYRGNHNQLVVEALGMTPAFDKLAEARGAHIINHEPSITLALDDECRM